MSSHTRIEDFIEVTYCETAKDFLEYLRISDPRWLPDNATSSPWIFRGQRKAQWSLLPAAMRTDWFDEAKIRNSEEAKQLLAQTNIQYEREEFQPDHATLCDLILQVYAEQIAIKEFVNLADQVGHPIPEDNRLASGEISVRSTLCDLLQHTPGKQRIYLFVPASVEAALAQHHGIPTRLLDWTFSPYAAAFFAAEDAIKNGEPLDYEIAVWAVDRTAMTNWDSIADHYETETNLTLILQRRGKISYLHAQGGVFTCDYRVNWHKLRKNYWRSFEEAIEEDSRKSQSPLLRKVVLPSDKTLEVLRLLAVEEVSRAHLMPDFDHVTETLRIRRRIEKLLNNE